MIRVHFPLQDGKRPELGLVAALRVGGLTGAFAGPGPEYSKYDKLNEEASKAFEVVDLDHADVMVYPYRATSCAATQSVANEARRRKIGCMFISWGDANESVSVPYGTVYRHSLFGDRRLDCEQAMPAEVSDPQVEAGIRVWPRKNRRFRGLAFVGLSAIR